MGYKKNMGRVLAGILAVGMLVSSMPSAVYAVENESDITVVTEQEAAALEETGTEAGQEGAGAESAMKEETEAGIENAGQPEEGKEDDTAAAQPWQTY